MQLFCHAKLPNHKFVDFKSPHTGATDRQPTNGESANGQRANCEGAKRKRPHRLCADADRRQANGLNPGSGSAVVVNTFTAFEVRHQNALDRWFDSAAVLRDLTRRESRDLDRATLANDATASMLRPIHRHHQRVAEVRSPTLVAAKDPRVR
ncbi:MAG: hypothetical protein ABWX92_02210 [Mycetocola sp.]